MYSSYAYVSKHLSLEAPPAEKEVKWIVKGGKSSEKKLSKKGITVPMESPISISISASATKYRSAVWPSLPPKAGLEEVAEREMVERVPKAKSLIVVVGYLHAPL